MDGVTGTRGMGSQGRKASTSHMGVGRNTAFGGMVLKPKLKVPNTCLCSVGRL